MFSSALLPGPGTYQPKFEAAELFERPPSAKLKPKRNAAVPRKVILPEMDMNTTRTEGYKKMLEVLDFLKPGARKEFTEYKKRKLH